MAKNVTAIKSDLAKIEDIDGIAASVRSKQGVVDIIVSNAGFTEQAPLETLTPEQFDRTFNLMAALPSFWRKNCFRR